MISADTVEMLTQHKTAPFDFILGCRMRRQREVNDEVLGRAGRFHKVADNLEVKEIWVQHRRYVVCRNPEEAAKDAAAREAIIVKLQRLLAEHGPKAVIGNRGYARFLRIKRGSVSIDEGALQRDARLDGKFVLRTNSGLSAPEVALAYKSLWRVERTFREEKSTLEVQPIYHHRDDTSIGHIVASFLAMRLEVDLQQRLDERDVTTSWPDLMRDLAQVQAVVVDLDGRHAVPAPNRSRRKRPSGLRRGRRAPAAVGHHDRSHAAQPGRSGRARCSANSPKCLRKSLTWGNFTFQTVENE